jgi:hypothetical protein
VRKGVSEAQVAKFAHVVDQIIHVKVKETDDPETGNLFIFSF